MYGVRMEAVHDVLSTVARLIAIELNVLEQQVWQAQSLRVDLGMDSIAAANLLFAIEEEFGISLELDRVEKIETLSQIAELVIRAQAEDKG